MNETVLVTGASGYVGGKLVAELVRRGVAVRVVTRNPRKLTQDWASKVDIVQGDLSDEDTLRRAMVNVGAAYFLVHSMDGGGDFVARDRALATSVAAAADSAGVARIVYLGGLHPDVKDLSPHLASRVEVGDIFLRSSVPTAVLQAAVVLGRGSASFDMLRYLTGRLPAMIAPKWLNNRIQPIAVDDAVHYLAAARDLPADVNRTFDIGGPDILTYGEMMQRFAAVTGQRRRIIVTVPVLTPKLASHWIGVVTPVTAGIAKPLVDSLVHEVICQENDLADLVGTPPGGDRGYDDAIRTAMAGAKRDRAPRIALLTTAAVAASAAIGGIATQPDTRWYRKLEKPSWEPPGAAFGIVWTPLYASIAVISSMVLAELDTNGDEAQFDSYRKALGINLALNTAWSWVFWRARRLDLAAVEAAVLAASSGDLARRAGKVSRNRGLALVPYAAWCSFATVLSTELAQRNRDLP